MSTRSRCGLDAQAQISYPRSVRFLSETSHNVVLEAKLPPEEDLRRNRQTTGEGDYIRFWLSLDRAVELPVWEKYPGKEFVGDQRELYMLKEDSKTEPMYYSNVASSRRISASMRKYFAVSTSDSRPCPAFARAVTILANSLTRST